MINKTFCYIDGYNLYCGFFINPQEGENPKTPNPPADKWLDIRKLLEGLLPDDCQAGEIKYFTAYQSGGKRSKRQQKYLEALETLGIEVIKGTFSTNKGKRTEKQTDTNLTAHMLYDCCKKDFNCVALVSNDSDFKASLKFAKEKFGKKNYVFSPQPYDPIANDLACYTNRRHKHICPTLLKGCRLPTMVKSHKPRIERPKNWEKDYELSKAQCTCSACINK